MVIRLVIAVIIVYLIYWLAKSFLSLPTRSSENLYKRSESIEGEDMVKDPYCGTYVPVSDAYKVSVRGETLYFCSEECYKKYKTEILKKE